MDIPSGHRNRFFTTKQAKPGQGAQGPCPFRARKFGAVFDGVAACS